MRLESILVGGDEHRKKRSTVTHHEGLVVFQSDTPRDTSVPHSEIEILDSLLWFEEVQKTDLATMNLVARDPIAQVRLNSFLGLFVVTLMSRAISLQDVLIVIP